MGPRRGLQDLFFYRDAAGRELFAPWYPSGAAYVLPDEATREQLHRRLVWLQRLIGIGGSLAMLLSIQLGEDANGVHILWSRVFWLNAALLAGWAIAVGRWTRDLPRTRVPAELRSMSRRTARIGAILRGWRLWLQIGVAALGMLIAVNIIRTDIGIPPMLGWIALAACAFALGTFVWAAWLDRRTRTD